MYCKHPRLRCTRADELLRKIKRDACGTWEK